MLIKDRLRQLKSVYLFNGSFQHICKGTLESFLVPFFLACLIGADIVIAFSWLSIIMSYPYRKWGRFGCHLILASYSLHFIPASHLLTFILAGSSILPNCDTAMEHQLMSHNPAREDFKRRPSTSTISCWITKFSLASACGSLR